MEKFGGMRHGGKEAVEIARVLIRSFVYASIRVDFQDPARCQVDGFFFFCGGEKSLEHWGQKGIITVNKGHIGAPNVEKPGIAS